MPKGKTGIFGTQAFFRVNLPKPGKEPASEEQRRLVALDNDRVTVMSELNRYRRKPLPKATENKVWAQVIDAVGGYLGQSKNGPPPTESEQRAHLQRISQTARKLDDLLDCSTFHMKDLMHKAVSRIGGDLPYLRKCLRELRDLDVLVDDMVKPKGRTDPYAEYLIRELVVIWRSATGKHPGKTGDTHTEPSTKSSPFYRWCQAIADKALNKPLPRDLIDTVIDHMRSDG